jgi:predicted PurR-regulated permease PerM
MSIGEAWSIAASIVSVILAIFSMSLAVYFFVQTKSTEERVTNSLSKIESQAESLQRLNAKWMDRLTRYVTEDRSRPLDDSIPQLVTVLAQLPQAITMRMTEPDRKDSQDTLVEELISCYIVIYYYTALTNYWAQFYVPEASVFDASDDFDNLVRRVVDGSAADFAHIAGLLEKTDQRRLQASAHSPLLVETRDFWRHQVRAVADLFVMRGHRDSV